MGERGDGCRPRTSRAVIEAVAEREDIEPLDLSPPEYEPLHDVVDPEALDKLFAPTMDGTSRDSGTVSFVFCDYEVTVHSDGEVTVE